MGLRDLYRGSRMGGGEGYFGYGQGQWAPGANLRGEAGGGDDRSGWMGRLADYKYRGQQRGISEARRMDERDVQERHKLSDVRPEALSGPWGSRGYTRADLNEVDRRRSADQMISDDEFGELYRQSDEGRRSQPNNMLQWAMSKLPGYGDIVNNQPDLTEEEMMFMDRGRTTSGQHTGHQKKYLGVDNEYWPTSDRYEQRPGGRERPSGGSGEW